MTPPPAITVTGSARIGGAPLFGPLRLEVAAKKWSCLLGPSGVGKSSLLRLIAGLETGIDFDGAVAASDGAPLDGRIAYMAQSDLLFPWLDVTGNVLTGARLRREPPDRARAAGLIGRVGLAAHAGKRPAELSGGQRQRAALARTLIEDRPVILLDEPFSALDARTRAEMQDLAAELLAGRTVLLVTHDPAEAARLGHRILVLDEAGLRAVPPPATPPVRAVAAPETLAAQTALFEALRRAPA
jgi:putative hydroxymethylpyrimidine transport system ATP-binding protein